MDEERLQDVLPPRQATYGVAEPFATGARLRYPDFDLVYLGLQVELPARHYRFRIEAGSDEQAVTHTVWGVISSETFTVGTQRFRLDFPCRDPGTRWRDTLVITPADAHV